MACDDGGGWAPERICRLREVGQGRRPRLRATDDIPARVTGPRRCPSFSCSICAFARPRTRPKTRPSPRPPRDSARIRHQNNNNDNNDNTQRICGITCTRRDGNHFARREMDTDDDSPVRRLVEKCRSNGPSRPFFFSSALCSRVPRRRRCCSCCSCCAGSPGLRVWATVGSDLTCVLVRLWHPLPRVVRPCACLHPHPLLPPSVRMRPDSTRHGRRRRQGRRDHQAPGRV